MQKFLDEDEAALRLNHGYRRKIFKHEHFQRFDDLCWSRDKDGLSNLDISLIAFAAVPHRGDIILEAWLRTQQL